MQAIRHLARRLNPKLVKKIVPSIQQAPQEARDARDDFKHIKDFEDELSTRFEIEILFREIDTNGDGHLDVDGLARALRKGKLPTSHSQTEQLFHERNGMINLEEFAKIVILRKRTLHQAYQTSFTKRRHGFTASIFRAAAKKAGVHLADSDVQRIMLRLDQNITTNHVTYKEFVTFMLLAPEINPRYFLDSWHTEAFSDDAESQFTTPRDICVDNPEDASFSQIVSKKIGCGGAAGCVSRTFTAPMDRIRVIMMTSGERMGIRSALTTATSGGGVSKLWMGNGVNCLKITPEMAIKLLSFDLIKNKIAHDPTNVSASERFMAGGMAGVISQLSIYPLEVVKTRLSIAAPGEVIGMTQCARQTLAQGGYRAFYAGVGPSVVGIIPYAAIDLSLNSILKDFAAEYLQQAKQETSVPVLLGCGMASSGTAAVLTFPLNVIRTKAQATGEPVGQVLRMLKSQGWRAFYRGLVPCLAKVLPATSISYATYEYLGGAWDKAVGNPKR
jgi:solute carrier family 25 phosphate transporter 23/24/25/41